MGKLLQVRDVPDDVHRITKARAAAKGVSLSEYVRDMLQQAATRPTPEEFVREMREEREPVVRDEPAWKSVRRLREALD